MSSPQTKHPSGPNAHTTAFTVGLSKNLTIPITVRLRRLETHTPQVLVANSQKFKDATVFQRLSDISANSEMFVKVQVFDGNHNPVTEEFQTPYTSFSRNKRAWDSYVRLPINYNQVGFDAYLRFTVLEMVGTCADVFGRGHLSLFNHRNSTLRKGCYKVPIFTKDEGETQNSAPINYGDLDTTNPMESRLFAYENGEFPRCQWLDDWAMPAVEKATQKSPQNSPQRPPNSHNCPPQNVTNPTVNHHLVLELPNFSLPVVFSDITYSVPSIEPRTSSIDGLAAEDPAKTSAMIVNSFDVPGSSTAGSPRIYDPDFHNMAIQNFNSASEEQTAAPTAATPAAIVALEADPIEQKFHSLAININNNSLLDKEVKPSPQMRDELWKILNRPSSAILHDHEKKLLWKFRYYFSKTPTDDSGSAPAPSQSTRQFFTKFLKCFNWENEYELDHAFKEIVPLWSVDKIDIGDALELLSNNFNPKPSPRRCAGG
ncbi:hypothetical protein JCM33374_g5233 [Metschnikowia sp. JCM 33374]|nr:hypothetical protein JCM33374_g5233 [Metschnikowia sp. JCM 33374]